MHKVENQRHWLRNGFYVAFVFLLLREWMLPIVELSEITQVYRIEPFLWAIFLFLVLQYVRCPLAISLVIQAIISLALIAHYFHLGSIFDLFWWEQLYSTFRDDIGFLVDQQWHRISGEMRTFLFLYGWSLLVYAIYAIVSERHSVSWLVSATFLYLLFLQYVWGLDTADGIWRTFAAGAVLTMISRNAKLAEQSDGEMKNTSAFGKPRGRMKRLGGWKAAMVSSCVFACAIGFSYWVSADSASPKPLIDSFASQLQQTGRTGYGSDDARLGKSLQPDHSLAFVGRTERLTYWKGETKSFYDGSGWHERNTNRINGNDLLDMSESSSDDEWIAVQQEVYVGQPGLGDTLFRGGSRVTIHELKNDMQEDIPLSKLVYDEPADQYVLTSGYRAGAYKLTTYLPKANFTNEEEAFGAAADESTVKRFDAGERDEHGPSDADQQFEAGTGTRLGHDPDGSTEPEGTVFNVGNHYLQLPATLPDRVHELAKQIAGDLEDPYEIAKAIETYLSSHYTYTLTNSEQPAVEDDFVDHFLFDQQRGYCDHFSTSMVVMLRALGIPARWAKGFTSGEVISGPGDGGYYEVAVRNSNAHSWVEAYIPDHGWVTFEPTPGFSGDPMTEWQDDTALPTFADMDDHGSTNDHGDRRFGQWSSWWKSPQVWFAAFIAAASLFMLAFVWDVLRRIRLLLAVIRLRFCKTSEEAKPALELLWKRWFELYGKKESDQTLREYVRRLKPKSEEQKAAMEAFLTASEQLQYDSEAPVKPIGKRIGTYWRKGIE